MLVSNEQCLVEIEPTRAGLFRSSPASGWTYGVLNGDTQNLSAVRHLPYNESPQGHG